MIAPGGRPVLVVGCPRSGTTWVGTMLGGTAGVEYVGEPDSVEADHYAIRAVRGLGPSPDLRAGDDAPEAYARLWAVAFGAPVRRRLAGRNLLAAQLNARLTRADQLAVMDPARPRLSARARAVTVLAEPRRPRRPARRVVKSVRAALALDWLRARHDPAVVIVRRHPLDVTASFLSQPWIFGSHLVPEGARARWCDEWGADPDPPMDPLGHAAWTTGYLMSVLSAHAAADPALAVVDHETLCADPPGGFRRLAGAVGLDWSATDDARLAAANRHHDHHTVPQRIASEQPGKWRVRLSPDEQRQAVAVLRAFPVAVEYPELAP